MAEAFKMDACSVSDEPSRLWPVLEKYSIEKPLLINVKTNRLFWHAGAGIDSDSTLIFISNGYQTKTTLFMNKKKSVFRKCGINVRKS